jgi:uncharacterized membrane protein required for colicin V production
LKELLSKLTWVDYIALVALLRGLYVGYKAGFFQELLKIVSYVVTMVLTLHFYEALAERLTVQSSLNESTARIAAFAMLLVGVYVILFVVRKVLVKMLKLGDGAAQKVFGALVGGSRLLVLLSFFFMLVDATPLKELKTDVHERSLTGPTISQAAPALYGFLSNVSPELRFLDAPLTGGK